MDVLWIQQRHMYSIYVLLVLLSPKFHSVSLKHHLFSSCRQFWDHCAKCTPYMLEHASTYPKSQISIYFNLQPAVFELQVILGQVRRMTPKWLETLKGQRHPLYGQLLPPSPSTLVSHICFTRNKIWVPNSMFCSMDIGHMHVETSWQR